jgi:CRISPR-associated protein Cas5d
LEYSNLQRIRVRGDYACFTRPELKTERVSYEVITPSAARGVLEAVLWKPAIFWEIRKILVLASARFIEFKRNEVNTRLSTRNVTTASRRGEPVDFYADEDRAQRNTLALRDVDYAIEARIRLTRRAGPEDNLRKFEEMFERRLSRGQFHYQPYLGCREFTAMVEPYSGDPAPISTESRDLGFMLQDIRYSAKQNVPVFFHAKLQDGILEIPDWQEAA